MSVEDREGNHNMDESALWSAAAVIGAAFVAWTACRWWHQRRIDGLLRELQKLETSQQNQARMSAQTRKQIDDLQRTVAEYRRRLADRDAARRALNAMVPDKPKAVPTLSVEAPAAIERPGGWADTQPM
jgi:septal ring factor EnvC (AmiA/AmiB activator)